ncbi:MAG TPA: NmrA family NAD(P)-binding protein [Gemmatimonadaceae bacterium]
MILIAGATGVLGSEIARRLRDRGQRVRALVRSASGTDTVATLEKMGVEIVRGDLNDRASLDAACRGVERVVSTVTAITKAQPGESLQSIDRDGNIRLIDAAAAAGVEQFVFVSFDTTGIPDAPLSAAKRDVEEHLKRTGLNHTILHPSLFMESWLGPMLFADPIAGTARIYGPGRQAIGYVSVADVAEVAVQVVTAPITESRTILFGGPEQITQREAVAIFSKAFGKELEIVEMPTDGLRAQWQSADDPFQKSFASLMFGIAEGWGAAPPPDPAEFPMRMTTVAEFAARQSGGSEA